MFASSRAIDPAEAPCPSTTRRRRRNRCCPLPGVELGTAAAGIKKWTRDDLVLISLCAGARSAGVFTQNRFAAAPVQVCRDHLALGAADARTSDQRGQRQRGHRRARDRRRATHLRERRATTRMHRRRGAAFFDRRDHGAAPGRANRGGAPRRACLARRRSLVCRRIRDHDHRYRAQGRIDPCGSRRPHRDDHRHGQGRRHDLAEHGDDAGLRRHRCGDRPGAAAHARCRDRRDVVQSHHHRWRYLDQRQLRDCRHRRAGRTADRQRQRSAIAGAARRARRCRADACAGHRSRWRRRDQVHSDHCRRRARHGRVQPRRTRDRQLAAGEDRVLRVGSEPRPHRVRDRQRRGVRSRSGEGIVLARRHASGRSRRPCRFVPRGRLASVRWPSPRSRCASRSAAAMPAPTVWTCDLSHDYVSINADYRS